ncbi:MAG: biopolymer transport protein TolR [Candidatus Sumerlaeota bacterium]|nr:biopolymer transport protein TolR [Candidatus Sumerlaeota bacterium]
MIRRHRAIARPMAQINVTSMLDITFVLLIAFMIVAPALRHGIEIELPTVRKAPSQAPQKPISIIVKSDSTGDLVYLDGAPVALTDLVTEISRVAPDLAERPVTLEGDKAANWEAIARVIAELRDGGITNIGIITTVSES